MSYLYDNPVEQAKLSDTLDRLPNVPRTPALFDNFWTATGEGLARGGLKLGELGTYMTDPNAIMAQNMALGFQGKPMDAYETDQKQRAAAREMLAKKAIELTPNPLTTGKGSQFVGQFAEVVPTAVVGGAIAGPAGAAALVGGAQGVGDYQESIQHGIDPATAAEKALLTGVVAGAGVAIPMAKAGASLATNLGIGAGVNVVTGAIQRGGTAAILDAGGYHDQAAQYKILDGEAIAIDTIMGAAFGGVGHLMGGAKPTGEQLDGALKLNERQHVEVEAQPGIHTTPESRNQGVRAMEETLSGLLNDDRAPDITDRAAKMQVEPNPEAARTFAETKAEVDEAFPAPEAKPMSKLEAGRQRNAKQEAAVRAAEESLAKRKQAADIGARLDARIKGDFAGVAHEYGQLDDSHGGQILNTDIARELSPEYRADRTRSADVHEAASAFVKKLYAEKLAAPTPEGKLPVVLFTGGGTGAGKSTGLKLLGKVADKAEIVYDTNMNKLASSVAKIDQALAAGRRVAIAYTFRDPVEALTLGALKRASRMEKEIGTGRTVPLSKHAETHIGARETIDQIAKKYADDPRVQITAIDNSRGIDNAKIVPVAEIPTIEHNGLERKLYDATKAEHAAGRISDAIFRGTAEEAAPQRTGATDGAGTGGQPEQVGQGRDGSGREAKANDVAPIYAEQARQILDRYPDIEIQAEDGSTIKFSDAIKEADAEIAAAEKDAELFGVAAACELGGMT